MLTNMIRQANPVLPSNPVRTPIASPRPVRMPVGGVPSRGRVMGSFKKGGKVKKTGVYELHEGEKVIPKKDLGASALSEPDADDAQPQKPKGRVPNEIHIRKMDDNSFHIRHEHRMSKEEATTQPSQEFTVPNYKRLVGHIRDTFSGE